MGFIYNWKYDLKSRLLNFSMGGRVEIEFELKTTSPKTLSYEKWVKLII